VIHNEDENLKGFEQNNSFCFHAAPNNLLNPTALSLPFVIVCQFPSTYRYCRAAG
jgi:hypothetical protein